VVLGGLIASTIFTVVLVPTLFSLALEGRDALARLLGHAVEADTAQDEVKHPERLPVG
jgi:hypothetical protein